MTQQLEVLNNIMNGSLAQKSIIRTFKFLFCGWVSTCLFVFVSNNVLSVHVEDMYVCRYPCSAAHAACPADARWAQVIYYYKVKVYLGRL